MKVIAEKKLEMTLIGVSADSSGLIFFPTNIDSSRLAFIVPSNMFCLLLKSIFEADPVSLTEIRTNRDCFRN